MRAIMESAFSVTYLITVITLGVMMVAKSNGNKGKQLYGIMAIVLGCGDAFHLVPRILGLLTDTMDARAASLGFGKLVTSITMTVFYVLLYHFWCGRYKKSVKSPLTAVVYTLAVCRAALCMFPQNNWLSATAPLSWGIYRNIPFAILGAVIVVLFFTKAKKLDDKAFRIAWLAVLLSFLFYIPVVLWADSIPAVGMLMIPKTVCYVWLVIMGVRSFRRVA